MFWIILLIALAWSLRVGWKAFMKDAAEDTNAAKLFANGDDVKKQLARGNQAPFVQLVTSLGNDLPAISDAVDALTSAAALKPCERWCEREPTNALAQLACGQSAVWAAWEARTSKRGSEVSEAQAKAFNVHLERAEAAFVRAMELAPDDPTPWVLSIRVAMGMSDAEGALECLQQAIRRYPGHHAAYRRAMVALAEKWLGSHNDAIQIARMAAEHAPVPHDSHGLIISAHLGVWQYYGAFDGDEQKALSYLQSVRAECELALAHSLLHAEHRESSASLRLRNDAAFYFDKIGDHARARPLLERIGERWTADPWNMDSAFPDVGYNDARERAGLKAARDTSS
jgi:tetratricopeptide (TPR) repeat protein